MMDDKLILDLWNGDWGLPTIDLSSLEFLVIFPVKLRKYYLLFNDLVID